MDPVKQWEGPFEIKGLSCFDYSKIEETQRRIDINEARPGDILESSQGQRMFVTKVEGDRIFGHYLND